MKELGDISFQTDTWSEDHARRAISAACRKVDEFLDSSLIRVYRREAAQEQEQDILRPLAVIFDEEPDPQVGNISIGGEPAGPISWCVHNREPLWVENIREMTDSDSVRNLLDDSRIDSSYLDFTYNPSSMLIIPLLNDNNLVGVFSVELDQSSVLKPAFVDTLRSMSRSMARIIHKANTHASYISDTTTAVENFLNRLQSFRFESGLLKEVVRTGFVARPYGGEFDAIGTAIGRYFSDQSIYTSHCKPNSSGRVVVDQIMKDIQHSHFHIADVTGNNPNVMMEVGMILNLSNQHNQEQSPTRKTLFLRNEIDTSELTFDLGPFQVYTYRWNSSERTLQLKGSGDEDFMPFEKFIETFCEELMTIPEFKSAKPYIAN